MTQGKLRKERWRAALVGSAAGAPQGLSLGTQEMHLQAVKEGRLHAGDRDPEAY